jgi:DnaJ-class molecular chaperone
VISIQVPMIDGSMKECNQRGVISSDTEIIIDHAGLPDPTNDGIRGRFIVKFDIEFPDAILGTQAID